MQRLRAVTDSMWFLPTVCIAVAALTAEGLLQVDERVTGTSGGVAFTGGSGAARELLSTVASSTLSLTGLVFSITIVVLQLTSSQFSPRVLRTFMRDRRTQLTLGTFLGTYVYALLALRAVRGEDVAVEAFVPGITIAAGFALVLLSVAMFVQYIHHIAQSIRVVTIINRIADETRAAIDRTVPADADPDPEPPLPSRHGYGRVVAAASAGVVTDVQVSALVRAARAGDAVVVLLHEVGAFVPAGAPLLEVHGGDVDDDRLRRHVLLGTERTPQADIGFGFRQLVDIAERALSPGVNDPTTAVQALDQIHDLLRRLAPRPFPSGVHRDDDGAVRLVVPVTSWSAQVAAALDEVRHWGASSPRVLERIRVLATDLLTVVDEARAEPLRRQVRLLERRAAEDLPAVEWPPLSSSGRTG